MNKPTEIPELVDYHMKRLFYAIQNLQNTPTGHPMHSIIASNFEEVDELFWTDVANTSDLRAFVNCIVGNDEFITIETMIKDQYPMASIVGTLEEIHGVPLSNESGKWTIVDLDE